ncbi:MAG: chemotaxis protein CheX [Spirochaetia bacterium]|jgi:CheY-specific phosphatase CheX|nr:chemotaxis protein CheX [Spirochaetia bacterium]
MADTNFAGPFFTAAGEVFEQMFGLTAKSGKPRELAGSEDHDWGISGILGLAGQAQGIISLRLPLALAESLLSLSGVETASEKERMATMAGLVSELTNIIAGNAVSSFTDLNLDISPPVVIKGVNHQITWPKIAPVIATRFETGKGAFELCVCFKPA